MNFTPQQLILMASAITKTINDERVMLPANTRNEFMMLESVMQGLASGKLVIAPSQNEADK